MNSDGMEYKVVERGGRRFKKEVSACQPNHVVPSMISWLDVYILARFGNKVYDTGIGKWRIQTIEVLGIAKAIFQRRDEKLGSIISRNAFMSRSPL